MRTTPMKHTAKTVISLVFQVGIVVFLVGCGKQPVQLDRSWSSPVKVTESQDGLARSGSFDKWHDTIIFLKDQYDRSTDTSTYSVMVYNNDSSKSWTQWPSSALRGGYNLYASAFDRVSDRIMFEQGHIKNNQLQMSAAFLRITNNNGFQIEAEREWMADKKSLLGETRLNAGLTEYNEPGQKAWPHLGPGIIDGADLYIPFCVDGFTYINKYTSARGPYSNGVFHSADYGTTWQIERISDFYTVVPTICRTKNYYYYFASRYGDVNQGLVLWFSRKSVSGGEWDSPATVKKPLPYGGRDVALAEGDTVHVCWLDCRHEKKYLNINLFPVPNLYSDYGNYEIAYCQRKDPDAEWSQDVILSEGVLFSFFPTMSVEGDKIVIAWSGSEKKRDRRHTTYNDIYYVTSKDGGKTWAKPLKVTDGAKDGIQTGELQVLVQNGAIHLFYIQGKENPRRGIGNQGPWLVYHQQRPFPN
jgi:hypothetical protein